MMKVSDWLSELNSHGVYDAEALAADFAERCSGKACWPTHSHEEIRQMIETRGVGGSLKDDNGKRLANGYEIAEALAEVVAKSKAHRAFQGRGSRFRAAIEALRRAEAA